MPELPPPDSAIASESVAFFAYNSHVRVRGYRRLVLVHVRERLLLAAQVSVVAPLIHLVRRHFSRTYLVSTRHQPDSLDWRARHGWPEHAPCVVLWSFNQASTSLTSCRRRHTMLLASCQPGKRTPSWSPCASCTRASLAGKVGIASRHSVAAERTHSCSSLLSSPSHHSLFMPSGFMSS